ncbi:DUF1622 domain-containing protein [Microbulbifer agarilyticus]|uniref:DUF1622 domain-containing protein n=1 Tax=Microbulbifer agarilyticus TaxID=260552 RepID=UPI001C95557E|nr:DUF1622 domain-containing protein [Microbulbifer agarilyticus]MBY6213106.1 DUF1622 domain-containing protein [Microbulbifer agarilyticus]
MEQYFHTFLAGAVFVIEATASLIMVWGFLVAVYEVLRASRTGSHAERMFALQMARCDLGIKLVFALELLIISDLLHTVVSHTLDDLWFLGALVAIRTIVGFFLNREIEQVKGEVGKL